MKVLRQPPQSPTPAREVSVFSRRRLAGARSVPLWLAVAACLLLNSSRLAAQSNGAWGNTAPSGNWSDAINWQGGNVADDTGATADFSQQTMTNNITVHLNSSRSIGNLVFGDLGNTYNWTVDSTGLLSLATPLATPVTSSAQPTITVNNGTATISAVVSGTQGFVLNLGGGTGTLVLSGARTPSTTPPSRATRPTAATAASRSTAARSASPRMCQRGPTRWRRRVRWAIFPPKMLLFQTPAPGPFPRPSSSTAATRCKPPARLSSVRFVA